MITHRAEPHPTKVGVTRHIFFDDLASPTVPWLGVAADAVAFWDLEETASSIRVHWCAVRPDLRGTGVLSSLESYALAQMAGRELLPGPIIHPSARAFADKLNKESRWQSS